VVHGNVTPDAANEMLFATVQQAVGTLLQGAPSQVGDQRANSLSCGVMLREIRLLKDKLHNLESLGLFDDDLWERVYELSWKLGQLSHTMKKYSKQDAELRMQRRVEEMREHWRYRKFHNMWRVGRLLGGSRLGKFTKLYATASTTTDMWEDRLILLWRQRGCSGQCIVHQEEVMRRADLEEVKVPIDLNHKLGASPFLKDMRVAVQALPSWKATPPWSLHNELWRVFLWSSCIYKKELTVGIGAQPPKFATPWFKQWLFLLVTKILASKVARLLWHLVLAFKVDKHNGKS